MKERNNKKEKRKRYEKGRRRDERRRKNKLAQDAYIFDILIYISISNNGRGEEKGEKRGRAVG